MIVAVIDASAYLNFILPEDTHFQVTRAMALIQNKKIKPLAPALLLQEYCNGLLMAFRRGRITDVQFPLLRAAIEKDGLDIETPTESRRAEWLIRVCDLAMKHGLTIYDATYLELAIRRECPLVTLDRSLAAAADTCGVLFS